MLCYRFLRRLFFGGVGTSEKVEDVRNGGNIGAAFVVVLTLTLPDGVIEVLVLIRTVPPRIVSP
jgi:hypothetical protein